jgi:hypothetical protein
MSDQTTYRSIVRDMIAAIEKEHGDKLEGWGIGAALGELGDVYRQAKALMTDERANTVFVTREADGRHDASINNSALSDLKVVFVDKTIFDKDGSLISITRDDSTVFSATVKMVIPSATDFDTGKVFEVAQRDPYSKGLPALSGMERSIAKFMEWSKDIPNHQKLLMTASEAINEHGFDAYSDYLTDAIVEFKAGMMVRAQKADPENDPAIHEQQLLDWLSKAHVSETTGVAIAAAVYERGMDKVMETFETAPTRGPTI